MGLLVSRRKESRYLCQNPRRTLMRTPVVKRQTTPGSGFCAFFRRVGPGAVILWQRVLTWFRSAGAALMGCTKHLLRVYRHRHGDGRELWEALGALETYLSPPTVLFTREATYLHVPVRSRFG